uniref:RING-type domain-containing protein n=1 Tax=Hucho hucho TaxID=62062 RepID=A0A4W5KHY4_9TELE
MFNALCQLCTGNKVNRLKDQSRCAVCEQGLSDPVSITCGHRFCRQCITRYWEQPVPSGHYGCPQCRKRFRTRPVLLQPTEPSDEAGGSENSKTIAHSH